MSVSIVELKQRLQFLRNAAPEEYDAFLKIFGDYTEEVTVAVAAAPSDQILVIQGRAQQQIALLRHFREAKR